jgi:hypothetical protein
MLATLAHFQPWVLPIAALISLVAQLGSAGFVLALNIRELHARRKRDEASWAKTVGILREAMADMNAQIHGLRARIEGLEMAVFQTVQVTPEPPPPPPLVH